MGRHLKKGLDYFNIDCVQEDSLNYLEAKHGISGYGVLVKLWRKIYMVEGYYCDWSEKNIYLFSKEVGVPIDELNKIVETCLSEGIFHPEMYKDYGVLTSHGVQKRWLRIVFDAKRKDVSMRPNLLIPDKTQDEKGFTPEEINKTPEESTQMKVNDIKVKEIKKEESIPAPASPPLPKSSGKKKNQDPEPFFASFVAAWFGFVESNFGIKPLFAEQDPRVMKSIIAKLKARAAQENAEWTEPYGIEKFKNFLCQAFQDKWLKDNFLLKRLNDQFEKIGRAPIIGQKSLPNHDIHYLFDLFRKDQLNPMLINDSHYILLEEKKLITTLIRTAVRIRRGGQLQGSNQAKDLRLLEAYSQGKKTEETTADAPVLRRIAVLEFFKQLKETGAEAVFHAEN